MNFTKSSDFFSPGINDWRLCRVEPTFLTSTVVEKHPKSLICQTLPSVIIYFIFSNTVSTSSRIVLLVSNGRISQQVEINPKFYCCQLCYSEFFVFKIISRNKSWIELMLLIRGLLANIARQIKNARNSVVIE